MPVLIKGFNHEFAVWCAMRIPHVGTTGFGPCQALGVAAGPNESDEFYAVVVFHEWQERNRTIQLSMAARSPKWASPKVIGQLLSYPFEELKCYKVWTSTPMENARALKFNRGIGFKQESILRHHYGPHHHAVICSILLPDYLRSPWLKAARASEVNYGQAERAAASGA